MKIVPFSMMFLTAVSMTAFANGDGAPMGSTAPFGGENDVRYAGKLWSHLTDARLVGADAIRSTPYTGAHPHGAILENFETDLTVSGVKGLVIVKKNYGGEGVSKQAVANDPAKYLKAVTVMYQRNGYDPDNQDWYWVKYAPDGTVLKNPQGKRLAGRVAKGVPGKGCIACHQAAPGRDYIFNHDRLAR